MKFYKVGLRESESQDLIKQDSKISYHRTGDQMNTTQCDCVVTKCILEAL